MEGFEQRLIKENEELKDKVNKLQDFMRTPKFDKLTRTEKTFLYRQLRSMLDYLEVLGERLEYYGLPKPHSMVEYSKNLVRKAKENKEIWTIETLEKRLKDDNIVVDEYGLKLYFAFFKEYYDNFDLYEF